MAKEYKAENIRVLDAVRLRPGMYIGTTSVKGLHHILWEIVDNSMDEIANGYGDTIRVKLYEDGSASVEDNGRGIPVDIHPVQKVSGVEVVFTQLHAGGKFDSSNYAHSGGLHGVGASVTNALSRSLHVEVYKNKKIYAMDFESVDDGKGNIKGGVVKNHLKEIGKTDKTGTFVRFYPDDRIFETVKFNTDTISKRLKELAFLNKGVHIVLEDERVPMGNGHLVREYCYEGGIVDFVKYLNETKNPAFDPPVYFEGEKDGIDLEVAFQYTDAYTENFFSYVNNIPTSEGGTHETGFKGALTKVLNDAARNMGLLKEKDENLLGDDYREGITVVLSIKMNNVQFEGQTKTKLGNSEAKVACDAITTEQLTAFFKKNKGVAEIILKKALLAAKVREAARREKELVRQKNSIDSFNTIGKLKNCTGKKPELNELFIVEGNSAGETAPIRLFCLFAANRSMPRKSVSTRCLQTKRYAP